MLSTTYDMLKRGNSRVDVRLFGQEILESSHAICAADMLIKGQDIRNICGGDSEANILMTDCFESQKIRLVIMNPPFGTPLGGKNAPSEQEKKVKEEHKKGSNGRFGAGLPSTTDAQLLFMQHTVYGTVGKVAIVENLEGLVALNSGVLKISLNQEYSTSFLYYVLQSEVLWTWFNYTSSGNSMILYLYEKDFYNFTFCLSSLVEQKSIVEFLDFEAGKINELILNIENQIKILEGYRKSIINVMVTKVDLVIFVSGIAVIAIELKCNTTGQNYEDAIRQFNNERDPKTRLFKFKSGTIVNFAMNLHEVYMCTHLKGGSSYFLPFNKGLGKGIESSKGNPHNENGLDVSYMWEDILKKDTILYLIDKIIYIKKEKKKDEITKMINTSETIIFPRYHQFNAVRKIVEDIEENETHEII